METKPVDAVQASNLKTEKRIMNISFAGSVLFLLSEMFFAFFTGSKAVLMDCVYDLADLAMIGPFMLLVPLLYKKETEKRPYGFSQIESLFVLVKYFILLGIDVVLVVHCVQSIIAGGNEVDASVIAVFELAISLGCVIMWVVLNRQARKYKSPSIKAELFIWKLDALSTLGVGMAFTINLVLVHTPASFICPYVDPGIAIVLAVVLVKEPILMIVESFRNLVLFAPEQEVFDKINDTCVAIMRKADCEVTFTDVIRTGRKMWLQVFFANQKENLSIARLKAVRLEIMEVLSRDFEHVDVVLIPDLEDGFSHVEVSEPVERRKDKIYYLDKQEEKRNAKTAAKQQKKKNDV